MDNFRNFLRAPTDPRIAGVQDCDAYSWADRCLANPRSGPMFAEWRRRLREESFRGITVDGVVRDQLFRPRVDDLPLREIVERVGTLLDVLSESQRRLVMHTMTHIARRAWMNPEVYMNQFGLRLDEVEGGVREAILGVVQACLSDRGYEKARNLMRINGFLGELVNAPRVMNQYSYNFNIFGDPQTDRIWGWNFYGHHLCLNFTVVDQQAVFTPVFMGAEPNAIDAGLWTGLSELHAEETLGLEFMRGLTAQEQGQARLYSSKRDPGMPAGRVAIGDELLLAGASQDNRVIAYEGLCVKDISASSRARWIRLVEAYHEHLPKAALDARMAEILGHYDETHFAWIGGTGDDDPFYYRVQSPVVLLEFDHHAGVFLSNAEPRKFHIHTLNRTPNGNDYGMALIRQCCEASGQLFSRLVGDRA